MIPSYYAGIGSRETPPAILRYFVELAADLSAKGWVLRSGGADGADSAFETGAVHKEIFLPWAGFNGRRYAFIEPPFEAYDIARTNHPHWNRLKPSVRRLMARNTQQVLGRDCKTPSAFVACWTVDASGKGGTGQAIRIARACNIPVFDFGKPTEAYAALTEFLSQ